MKVTIDVELPDDYTQETYEQTAKFVNTVAEAIRVFAAKQEAYGRGNIAEFGQHGVLIRSHDKFQRLKNLLFNNRVDHVEDDSVRDAWLDLGNYGLIGLMCHDLRW